MSSFFANNTLGANNQEITLAFFIPQGTFQQNNQIQDIRLMKPRYGKIELPQEYSEEEKYQQPKSQQIQQSASPQKKQRKYSKKPSLPQKQISTSPNIATPQKTIQTKADTPSPQKSIKNTEITKSASSSKYQLEDNERENLTTTSEAPQIAEINIKDIQQKSLKELLSEIPYPDSHQPKFKQLYSLYGLELRSFQRRGKFPINRDQEEALAKANSIKKFTVQ